MKKFSLFLVLVLLMQAFCLPVFAEPTDPSSESTASAPTETVAVELPSGDLSVSMGTNSINAQQSIATTMDYTSSCKASLIYELGTDTMVYAQNADTRVYPASLTKVMTCLLALENSTMSEMVTVSESALEDQDPSGSNVQLQVGEQMSMKNMLYCLMVASANDAAAAIAEHIGGSQAGFVEMMNRKAAELGCTGTHFANPHGLHDEDHYTTARDMAKIMLAALEYEAFNDIYSTSFHTVPATNMTGERELETTNYMISEANYELYIDKRVIGGKTGFTTPAGRCFIGVSESNGMKLLTVVMGADALLDDQGNVLYSYGSFIETKSLLNLACDHYQSAQVLNPDQVFGQFAVADGVTGTQGYVASVANAVLPIEVDISQLRYEYLLNDGGLTAPIQAGQSIGSVRVWYNATCVAQQELYATVDVEKKVVPQESTMQIDPAKAIADASSLWHIVLIVILVLLVLIVAMMVISRIRYAMIRARRKRRRRDRRRSR